MTAHDGQSGDRERVVDGQVVVWRKYCDLKPGDLVQHYSRREQTGDPIRREVLGVIQVADGLGRMAITWRDPDDAPDESYDTREYPDRKVHVIVRAARQRSSVVAPPFPSYEDAVDHCLKEADDYGSVHAAMVDLLFSSPENYEDAWLLRLWELGEFVRDSPCRCTPDIVEDHDACPRCRLLNIDGDGR